MSDHVPFSFASKIAVQPPKCFGINTNFGRKLYSAEVQKILYQAMNADQDIVVVPFVYKFGPYAGEQEHIVDLKCMTAQLRGTSRVYELVLLVPLHQSETDVETASV